MSMKNAAIAFWLLFFVGMAFTSCTKNDENTVALIGTEYYIDDILSVIPESLQSKFMAAFGPIPEGPVPPKIEGNYVMARKQRVSSNLPIESWPLDIVEDNVWLHFSNQHNGIVRMDLSEATETTTDTVFVCGNGQDFAVYFIENKVSEWCRVKRGIVMKGKASDEGLVDFRYATIIMETEDYSNGQMPLYPSGSYFISKDEDGIATIE